ncbi:MAG TPA: hypothetical protein VFA84_11355 [Acidimicrobiales bacterium]|nr:hypothetical protein [Acidimicrobiales bacterium]
MVEVVITMAVIGLITAALAAVIIVVFQNDQGAATASTSARDKELVGLYFTRDIQSARSLSTQGPWACTSRALLEISTPEYTVDYVARSGANGLTGTLTRRSCRRGGASSSDDILVRALDSAAPAPTVICAPDNSCIGSNESVTLTFQLIHETQPYSVTAYTRASVSPPTTRGSDGGD